MASKHPPPNWPSAVAEAYDPVRPLGSGGFGSVWLASKKKEEEGGASDANDADGDGADDSQVAIKLIGSGNKTSTEVEEAYARREVAILSELSHPRIVRLVDSFSADGGTPESEDGESSSPGGGAAPTCIALSYARGPTVEQLLLHGGALGVHLARTVTAQLVDAVSYLHGRAVIHRDIKPDNCIVTGALPSDDAVYSDGLDGEGAATKGRWRLTLIDFGFARALHPSEVNIDLGLYKTVHDVRPDDMREEGANPAMLPSLDAPLEDAGRPGGGGKNDRGRSENLDKSISKKVVRNLSALGNRSYAAPEMLKGVRRNARRESELGISRSGRGSSRRGGVGLDGSMSGSGRRGVARGKSQRRRQQGALAECVSDYGMIADAFSLGATIRYVLTGVPPQFAVDDFMAMRNNPVAVTARAVGKLARKVSGKKKKKMDMKDTDKRKKRYKGNDKIPKEAATLVRALTHWDHNKRTTVRAARLYPWIKPFPYASGGGVEGSDGGSDGMESSHSVSGGKVNFLRCALDGPSSPTNAKETKKEGQAPVLVAEEK